MVYKHYTSKNGLPHDITYQIIQDSKGYIWIGTDDGLTKFNGTSFKNYSDENGLKSNYVIDISEINPNKFLIGTWGAGLHYLENDSIFKPTIKNDNLIRIKKVYKLDSTHIYGSINYTGSVLYDIKHKKLTKNALSKIKKTQNIELKNTTSSKNITIYNSNEKFINNKLFLFSSPKKYSNLKGLYELKSLKLNKLNFHDLNNIEVHSIATDTVFFYASSFNKIFIFKDNKLVDEKIINIVNEKIISLEVRQNKFYFRTLNSLDGNYKVYCYDSTNNFLVNISTQLNITSFTSDFLLDSNSNLWITTYGQGVFYFPNFSSTFYDANYFSSFDLKDIKKINQSLVILTPNTIYEIENDLIKNQKEIPVHTEMLQINEKLKKINLITSEKIKVKKKFSGYKVTTKSSKLYSFNCDSIEIRFDRHLILIYKKGKLHHKREVHHSDSYIAKAISFNKKIYVIYNKLGIAVFDEKSGKQLAWWNKKNGFYTDWFRDIIVKNGNIWLASYVGIIKVIDNKKYRYTKQNGLLSNHINDLEVDKHGVLWVATQKGLNVFSNNSFYSIKESLGQKSSFTTKVIEHNNDIYVTGNSGLFKLNNTIAFSPKSNTKLFIKQEKSAFTLNTINYTNSKSISIAYKLNENWIKISNKKLDFQNIKQGNYTIKFRYKDDLSDWKYSKPYHFKITYPWHQQTWFYVTVTTILFSGVVLLLFWGLRRSVHKNKVLKKNIEEKEKLQKALKEVRKNVARDFHDELGNKLASISITSNLLIDTNYATDKDKQNKKIKQIKKDADYLYHGMKDFVWALDHKNDDLQQLQVYLNDFGENLFENSSITFYSSHNFSSQKIILPFYWSKQLVLIFKEAMTNVLKHSKATKVFFNFEFINENLKIILEDNGIGFKSSELKRINGIKNMKYRAETLNQKIKITSSKGVIITFIGNIKEEINE